MPGISQCSRSTLSSTESALCSIWGRPTTSIAAHLSIATESFLTISAHPNASRDLVVWKLIEFPTSVGISGMFVLLERHQRVYCALSVAGALQIGQIAAAAISDARLGDLGVSDGVVGGDVLWTDDA